MKKYLLSSLLVLLILGKGYSNETFHLELRPSFYRTINFYFSFSAIDSASIIVKQSSYSKVSFFRTREQDNDKTILSSKRLAFFNEFDSGIDKRILFSAKFSKKDSKDLFKILDALKELSVKEDTFSTVMFDGFSILFDYQNSLDTLSKEWSNFNPNSIPANLVVALLEIIEKANLSFLVNESIYNFYRRLKQPGWRVRLSNQSPRVITVLNIPDSCEFTLESFLDELPATDTIFVDLRFYHGPYTYCFYDTFMKRYKMVYWIERPDVHQPPIRYHDFYRR